MHLPKTELLGRGVGLVFEMEETVWAIGSAEVTSDQFLNLASLKSCCCTLALTLFDLVGRLIEWRWNTGVLRNTGQELCSHPEGLSSSHQFTKATCGYLLKEYISTSQLKTHLLWSFCGISLAQNAELHLCRFGLLFSPSDCSNLSDLQSHYFTLLLDPRLINTAMVLAH